MYRFAHTRGIINAMSRLSPDPTPSTASVDAVILGAGLIGLSLALELTDRGAAVTVIDRGRSLAGASTAAAGMLAAEDPYNPPELQHLSRLSAERYPAFLRRIEALSGIAVPFQTETTIQYRSRRFTPPPRRTLHRSPPARRRPSRRHQSHLHPAPRRHPPPRHRVRSLRARRSISSGVHAITTRAVVYAAGAWTSEVMASVRPRARSPSPRAKARCCASASPIAAQRSPSQRADLHRPPHRTAPRPAPRSSAPP